MKKASKMRSRSYLEPLRIQIQLRIAKLTPAPPPRQRFGLDFRGRNPTEIYKKFNQILYQILKMIFHRFWMNFELFFNTFLIKMNIKIEKGDFMKMSVSPTRNTHFHGFGTCFCDWKSIKKSIKKRKGFRNTFLINFASFSPPFWSQKASKNNFKFK